MLDSVWNTACDGMWHNLEKISLTWLRTPFSWIAWSSECSSPTSIAWKWPSKWPCYGFAGHTLHSQWLHSLLEQLHWSFASTSIKSKMRNGNSGIGPIKFEFTNGNLTKSIVEARIDCYSPWKVYWIRFCTPRKWYIIMHSHEPL